MFKKGDNVVRLLAGAGTETASIAQVAKVDKKKALVFLDADDTTEDGTATYSLHDGRAVRNWVPGFSSRIVPLES